MIDLRETFECGQCFRWNRCEDGSYIGIVNKKIYILKSADDIPPELYSYFDMDTDYDEIQNDLIRRDKTGIMERAVKAGKGIRILKQDLWETIVSFIISQNNNIPRIKSCIEKLADNFGEYIGEYDGKKYFDVPGPEKLSGLKPEDLAPVKLGYRDRFLIESAKMFMEGEREISKLPGVGPKVESCIRLFGMHDMKSFPIDVWVKRVMHEVYGFDENDVKGMTNFARDTFGDYAGLAQQYLFNYVRNARR